MSGALVRADSAVKFRVIGDPGKQAPHANSMDRAREAMAPRPGWSPEGSLGEDRRREAACFSVRDSPEIPLTPRAGWWRPANACGCAGSSPPARSALQAVP
jgi:hypothetical protein